MGKSIKLPLLSEEQHEDLCRRCGQSCHFAVQVNGLAVVIDELHCKFLKKSGGTTVCTVYENRYEKAPWCHSARSALDKGLLAQDCPYVKNAGVSGYRGKTKLHPRLQRKIEPAVLQQIIAEGVPYGVSLEGLRSFFERCGVKDVRVQVDEERSWIRIEKK